VTSQLSDVENVTTQLSNLERAVYSHIQGGGGCDAAAGLQHDGLLLLGLGLFAASLEVEGLLLGLGLFAAGLELEGLLLLGLGLFALGHLALLLRRPLRHHVREILRRVKAGAHLNTLQSQD
jgi:hypothetical protein